jgi:hypothetical protein
MQQLARNPALPNNNNNNNNNESKGRKNEESRKRREGSIISARDEITHYFRVVSD